MLPLWRWLAADVSALGSVAIQIESPARWPGFLVPYFYYDGFREIVRHERQGSGVRGQGTELASIGLGVAVCFIQLGLDGCDLAGHAEFAENSKGLLQLLFFGLAVTLLARQQTPIPIATG